MLLSIISASVTSTLMFTSYPNTRLTYNLPAPIASPKTTTSPNMDKLPYELIYQIGSHLSKVSDIYSFLRTCRRHFLILLTVLFRHNATHHISSALFWAARHGKREVAERAITYGANVDACVLIDPPMKLALLPFWPARKIRMAPLDYALRNGHSAMATYLRDCGARRHSNPLMYRLLDEQDVRKQELQGRLGEKKKKIRRRRWATHDPPPPCFPRPSVTLPRLPSRHSGLR